MTTTKERISVNPKYVCSVCGEKFDYPFSEIGDKLLWLHMEISHPPKYQPLIEGVR